MHTDEYEISVWREIALCRKVIERLKNALQEKEARYGMATKDFLSGFKAGLFPELNHDFLLWSEESHELHNWQHKLREYEEAFQMLKNI